MKRPLILIAGAGIGGLSAALSLLRRGFACRVFEQASELREIGAGLWVSANGARVLFELGLGDALRKSAIETEERVIRLWNSGKTWWLYRRGAQAPAHQPYVLLRAQLLRLLVDAVRDSDPDAIRLNAKCTGFSQDENGVRLHLDGGETVAGDALVGADGVHSKIREAAFGAVAGHYTNALAWRGLVPMERLRPHHRRWTVATWVGPLAHCTVYPVRWDERELMTFSGQVEHADWQAESWSQTGTIDECLRDFAGWHEDILELVRNADTLHKWGLFVRDPLPRWSTGRVTLLGDACHSMVPYLGQGVNMAIEDGHVLARCLELDGEPSRALKRYEGLRTARTAKAVRGSSEMQYTFHNPALAQQRTAEAYVEETWSPQRSRARYDWIYEYDATKAPLEGAEGAV